jgi:glyoxylase-like metal-dependent hydrolase (beta-lactamase superfamily II)
MGFQPHQLKAMGMEYADPPRITRFAEHGDVLDVGDLRLEIRHCPGHTLGHIVLVAEGEQAAFTGDCLFSGTIGRTDLPGGDHEQLIASINRNILSLPEDFSILCGHGPDSTVGREKLHNPFLNGMYDHSAG